MIDVIVVTHNAAEHLRRCLSSIGEVAKEIPLNVTVVDNASTDGSRDAAESFRASGMPLVSISLPSNLGYSGAANVALRQTSSEYVLLLDDDAQLSPVALRKLYSHLEAKPDCAIAGPKVLCADAATIFCAEFSLAPLQACGEGELDCGQRDYCRTVDALVGTCWIMRRGLLGTVGYFNEAFYPSQYEDLDYCLRTRLAGHSIVYDGGCSILHDRQLRDGGLHQNLANRERFKTLWAQTLSNYPIAGASEFDGLQYHGFLQLHGGNSKASLEYFRAANDTRSGYIDPRVIAQCEVDLQEFSDAVQTLHECARIFPGSALVQDQLAHCFRHLGETENANAAAKRALELL